MERRIVTRQEAEAAFTREFGGDSICYEEGSTAVIEAVRLPETPTPGGVGGKGFLPLTYVYEADGEQHTVESDEGPEVDEARAILRATLPDYRTDQRIELWFEEDFSAASCDCGCGC
jgi:hypothetical protein